MKYILEFEDYINEDLKNPWISKKIFMAFNDKIPLFKNIKDSIHGTNGKKSILKPLTIVAGSLGVTISAIYLLMWYHNKKLDGIQPQTEAKLKRYTEELEKEFSPKEFDDFIRLLSTDKQIIKVVQSTLNGNTNPENEKYLRSKLTDNQIKKLFKIANNIDINESLNEAEWYEILGLDIKDIKGKDINDPELQQKIKSNYRKLMIQHHPDKGGDVKMSQRVNNAKDGFGDDDSARSRPFRGTKTNPSSSSNSNNNSNNYSNNSYNRKGSSNDSWSKMKNYEPIDNDDKFHIGKEFVSNININIVQWVYTLLKQYIIDHLLGILILQTLSNDRVTNSLIRQDKTYEANLELLQYTYENLFSNREQKQLNKYFSTDLEYINYIQRLNRIKTPNDRKRLSNVISEHLKMKMPQNLYRKYLGFMEIGEESKLFTKGTVTAHSLGKTKGKEHTMDVFKTLILPKIEFYN